MLTPLDLPTTKPSKMIFTFHPKEVNDSRLLSALRTAQMIARQLHSDLIAMTLAAQADPSETLHFEEQVGESIETRFVIRPIEPEKSDVDIFLASAELIVIVTHLPKSPIAGIFDHFGQMLFETSQIPLLAIRAPEPPLESIRRILFVSDVSSKEHFFFRQAVEWAKAFGAELIVTTSLAGPWLIDTTSIDGFGSVLAESDDQMTAQTRKAKATAKDWWQEASKLGVKTRFRIAAGLQKVASGSLEVANETGADLIVVGRTRPQGVISTVIFGGTLEDLLAISKLPILILTSANPELSI